jgi:hypothetical protein
MNDPTQPVCIIGAGPGGLLAAAAIKKRGIPFEILDAGRQVGGIWDIDRDETPMYESAHFISSRTLSGFWDFPMPDSYPDYPRYDKIFEYIQAYARHHDLVEHITFGVRVESVTRLAEGGWRVSLDSGDERSCSALCVAAGNNWIPRLPELAGTFSGEEYHSFHYRRPAEFEGKRVLVVGGGNSGADIACDAARSADKAYLSLRRGYYFIPKFIFGQPSDVFAHNGPQLPSWLEERVFGLLMNKFLVGDLTKYGLPKPDHPILQSHPILNTQVLHHLGHGDIEARSDVAGLDAKIVRFADGTTEEVDLIVWATGYERRFPFLPHDAIADRDGIIDLYLRAFHRRHADLFFVGSFETDGAAYGLYGQQAELVASYLDPELPEAARAAFDTLRTSDRPNLRGSRNYLDSPRHAYYVKGDVYQKALQKAARTLGA